VSACARSGTLSCLNSSVQCDAVAGAPGVETCNGLDDNCNGQVDEASASLCSATGQSCSNATCSCPAGQSVCGTSCQATGGTCSVGVGACLRQGNFTCLGRGVVCDAFAGVPAAETCNGVDDNCNGQVDEGVTITCSPDEDNDRYATSSATSQRCPDSTRAAYGNCPVGFVAPTASLGTDCSPTDPALYRMLATRDDGDGDTYCTSVNVTLCVGATAPAGRRFSTTCAATDDCNDTNASLYLNYTVRADADGDSYCVGLPTAQCAGAGPLPGWRLQSACLGDDCRDTNNQATTTCLLSGAYSTIYNTKLCGIGPPPTEHTYVSVASFCPFGFSLFGYHAEIASGGGSCSATDSVGAPSPTNLTQSCNFLEGTTCRVVGDCVAN
jgi:hypothetical protein